MVDTPVLGTGARKGVWVRVPPSAPHDNFSFFITPPFCSCEVPERNPGYSIEYPFKKITFNIKYICRYEIFFINLQLFFEIIIGEWRNGRRAGNAIKCNLRKGHTQQDYLCIIIFKLWGPVYISTYRFEPYLPDNCRISTSVVCNLPKVERTVRFCYPAQKNTKIFIRILDIFNSFMYLCIVIRKTVL